MLNFSCHLAEGAIFIFKVHCSEIHKTYAGQAERQGLINSGTGRRGNVLGDIMVAFDKRMRSYLSH